MRKLIITAIVCCFFSQVIARYTIPKKKDALEFLKRTVLVEIKEYDKEELKKLGFETYEEDYKIYISEYNSNFQYAAEHFWKMENKVEFKTKGEIDELLKENQSKYAVVRASFRIRERITHTANPNVAHSKIITEFLVYQFNTSIDDKEIFWIPMPTCFLTPGDFIFIVQQFNIYMEAGKNGMNQSKFFKIGPNLDTLKNNKTLLLPNYWLPEDMTEEKIKKNYGYSYRIADYADIEDAIKNKDGKYAYVTFIYCAVLENPSWVTVDAATGNILTLVTQGGLNVGMGVPPPKGISNKGKWIPVYRSTWGKNLGAAVLMGFRSKVAQMLNKK